MKKLIRFLPLLIFTFSMNAQENCKIYYDYDKAGQRIKRYYDCNGGNNDPKEDPPGSSRIYRQPADGLVFELFPNPTEDVFYIRSSAPVWNAVLTITDMNGKLAGKKEFGNGSVFEYDMSALASGSYLIILVGDKQKTQFKLIKQ